MKDVLKFEEGNSSRPAPQAPKDIGKEQNSMTIRKAPVRKGSSSQKQPQNIPQKG